MTSSASSSKALFVDRNFGPWFFGHAVSNTGDWVFNVGAAVVLFEMTGSALVVGLLSVSQFTFVILVSPLAGSLSDRYDKRMILLVAQCLAAAAALALAVPVILAGPGALNPSAILVAAVGIGLGRAVTAPALHSLVPSIVAPQDLAAAVSLTTLTFGLGRVLGPALAGLLVVSWGAEYAFVVNALSFLALIIALAVIKPRPTTRSADTDFSMRSAWNFVARRERLVLRLLTGVGILGIASDPVITLAPALVAGLGGVDSIVAAAAAAFGFAAAVAALIGGRLQARYGSESVASSSLLVVIGGAFLVSISAEPVLFTVSFGAMGAGVTGALTSITTDIQRLLPDELRGRVMSLWTVCFLGTRPVAAILHGGVADIASPRLAMGLTVALAAGGWILLTRPRPN